MDGRRDGVKRRGKIKRVEGILGLARGQAQCRRLCVALLEAPGRCALPRVAARAGRWAQGGRWARGGEDTGEEAEGPAVRCVVTNFSCLLVVGG